MRRFLSLFLFLSVVSFGQNTSPTTARTVTSSPSPYFGAGPVSNVVVTGAPYSADGQSQNVRTLGDGTLVKSPLLTWRFYRDAQGRTRLERPAKALPGNAADTPRETIVEITDPAAQVKYTLDATHKVAQRQNWTAPKPSPSPAPPVPKHGEQILPPESLGTQIVEGIPCEGTRTKVIWPIGSMGNDRELSAVTEIWKSPDLQLVILRKYNNPLNGESTQKLFNIVRADPPANLFQPPSDYTMEDYAPRETFQSMPGVYKIGGPVSAPTLISKREAEYTNEARDNGISGTIMLSLIVQADGTPGNIRVTRPLGFGLDEKAVEAVSQWRFKPALKEGVPVAAFAQVEVSFRLMSKRY